MPTLLVIDDERNVLYSLEKALRSDSLAVLAAATAKQGIALAREQKPDAVLLDVRLPDMSGLDAFVALREADPQLPVIMMTAFATTDTAIEAMKRGAFEYLTKPVDLKQLRSVVAKAIDLRKMAVAPPEFKDVDQWATSTETIVGRSPQMQEVYKAIGRVAGTDVNVLILGESGTGKELVARAIHHHSRRSQKPLLAINCAAIPETLLVDHFIHAYNAEVGRRVRSASPESIELLQQYSWPGNVRELQGAIKNALVNATQEVLTADCLTANVRHGASRMQELVAPDTSNLSASAIARRLLKQGEGDIYHKAQLALDRVLLDEVLKHTSGNQVEAARRLGISRTTLRAKLQALGMLSSQPPAAETEQSDQ